MNRRSFLKVSTGVSFSLFAVPAYARGKKKPNLVIIHTDEHNFRTLGCYRKLMSEEQAFVWGKGVKVDTPNIDWIADNGAVCDSFYASTPVCSPSRASFISGKYPQNTPVHNNGVPLDDDIVTFAEVLGKNGYATGYAGKWHLNGQGKPQWEPKHKFGFADNRYMYNRGHWKKFEDGPNGPRIGALKNGKSTYNVDNADEKSFATDWLCDKTIEFINKNSKKPFCYMVSIPDPHGPNTVRAPYDRMYSDVKFQLPRTASKSQESVPSWAKGSSKQKMNNASMGRYFGMVKCIDDNVKKILDALRKKKILENTIVIFTSDHGDMCYEHGKHNKGYPLEASAKVPFVIHYPAKIKAGTVVDEVMGCADFMPTILKLMDVQSPATEGRDHSKMFVSGKAPAGWNDVAFFRGTGDIDRVNWIGAVTKQYKLIYQEGENPWLYDLKKDPDELINYYNDPAYAKILKKLAGDLLGYGKDFNDPRINTPQTSKQLAKASRPSLQ